MTPSTRPDRRVLIAAAAVALAACDGGGAATASSATPVTQATPPTTAPAATIAAPAPPERAALDAVTGIVGGLAGFVAPEFEAPPDAPYSAVAYTRDGALHAAWAFPDPSPLPPAEFLFGVSRLPPPRTVATEVGEVRVYSPDEVGRDLGGAAHLPMLCGRYQVWVEAFGVPDSTVADLVAIVTEVDCAALPG